MRHYIRGSLADRFWAKVTVSDNPAACWKWNANCNPRGYGTIHMKDPTTGKRRTVFAHRASWMLSRGDIPDRMHVLHKCDNPPCCNPEHLWLGTLADNTQDMIRKGRGRAKFPVGKGERHPGAKLTEETARYALERRAAGAPLKEIANELGVGETTISVLANGRTWKHLHMPSAAPVDVPQPVK